MLYKNNSFRIQNIYIYVVCLTIVYLSMVFVDAQSVQSEPMTDKQQDTTVNLIIGEPNEQIETVNDEIETTTETTTEKVETTTEPTTTVKVEDTTKTYTKTNFGIFKSYTDYKCLSKSTKQWQLQEKAYTDENGLRKIGDAYLVALGSYYGTTLGTEYTVTLSNGSVFKIILCDCKDDRHTNKTHQYTTASGCVLEFYVETEKMPKQVRQLGSISAIEEFKGNVVSIEKTAEQSSFFCRDEEIFLLINGI